MSQTSPDPSLAAQLDAVARREASFRLKTVQEFLVYTTQLKAQQQKTHELYDELGERNTYVHRLHQEAKEHAAYVHTLHEEAARRNEYVHTLHVAVEEAAQRERALVADLETFAGRLRQAEDEASALRTRVAEMKSSWGWGAASWLRALQRKLGGGLRVKAATPELPGYDFVYFLRTSPYRVYRERSFKMSGWVFPRDGGKITGLRVRVGEKGAEFPAQYGLAEPEVIAHHGTQANNPRPGFAVTFSVEPGRQMFRLEAQLDNGTWYSVLSTPIWAELGAAKA